MQITTDKVVSFHYELREVGGELLESSLDGEPTLYLHGHSNILVRLEEALEGKAVGEKVEVELTPEQGYGLRREGAVQRVPIKHLHDHATLKNKIKVGSKVLINTQQGPWEAIVLKVGKF